MYNSTLDRDETAEEDRVIRATFNWTSSGYWRASLKLEDASFNRRGRNMEVIEPVTLPGRSEEHTSELQSRGHLVCRLLLEKKKCNYKASMVGKDIAEEIY